MDEYVKSPVDEATARRAVAAAAAYRGYDAGVIGIRVTGDAEIHHVNRQHLGHDYPTDVISFAYRDERPILEGELIVSAETAHQRAAELGWPVSSELILYMVHGTLHIAGMDDQSERDRAAMREAERCVMLQLGIDEIVRCGADQSGFTTLEGRG